MANELQRRVDEMTIEINNLHSANNTLEGDNMRLKGQVSDLTDRVSNLDRENRQLGGKFLIQHNYGRRDFAQFMCFVNHMLYSRKSTSICGDYLKWRIPIISISNQPI